MVIFWFFSKECTISFAVLSPLWIYDLNEVTDHHLPFESMEAWGLTKNWGTFVRNPFPKLLAGIEQIVNKREVTVTILFFSKWNVWAKFHEPALVWINTSRTSSTQDCNNNNFTREVLETRTTTCLTHDSSSMILRLSTAIGLLLLQFIAFCLRFRAIRPSKKLFSASITRVINDEVRNKMELVSIKDNLIL